MRILFTGASSFTGMWFVRALIEAGHQVVAPLKRSKDDYSGVRLDRILKISSDADVQFSTPFGSLEFDKLIKNGSFDLLCHHAADVTDYKSSNFDPIHALKNNVGNIASLLQSCKKILLTGSVFEQNEGFGSDNLRAVSPYGLSKGLTSEVFKYYCDVHKSSLGKFVIPNPFGPFEEFRYTSFLAKNWLEKKEASVTHPDYVRDNIHVTLLAKAYLNFAESFSGFQKFNPSGYSGSQASFTERFAIEMRKRLNVPCQFQLIEQKDFSEPKIRVNTDLLDYEFLKWDEKKAWDDLAFYYEKNL